jgi:hypothetical protein
MGRDFGSLISTVYCMKTLTNEFINRNMCKMPLTGVFTKSVFIWLQTFWEDVRCEMIQEKGIDPVAVDKIGKFVELKGRVLL